VSLVNRTYPEIVKDMLTVLTGGIASEAHEIVYDKPLPGAPTPLPRVRLRRRPVRRISSISGFIPGRKDTDEPLPYIFGLTDYELVASDPSNPDALDTIRFLPFGRSPADKTTIDINYYPRNAEKSVITDVTVGSVARTMLETVAKELASVYAQLEIAYDSGFVETAKGVSLDRVVALLGFRRFRAGRPAGLVTFTRRPGSAGEITIPAGTPVTDPTDKIRYETLEPYLMRSEESVAQVRVRGASEGTPVVQPNTLTVIARAVAGLSTVTNERETTRVSDDESDDDLRLRVRSALNAANRGTVESIRYGLLQLAEVRDATVKEMPNGIPGEIEVTISLDHGLTELPQRVKDRLEQLRPAGVHLLEPKTAATLQLAANVELLLAGSALPSADLRKLRESVTETLAGAVQRLDIGAPVRIKPIVAAILRDARIVDVPKLMIGPAGGTLAEGDFKPAPGMAIALDKKNVSFAKVAFETAPPPSDVTTLDVAASFGGVELIAGVTLPEARTALETKLQILFATAKPGDAIDAQKVLDGVRDDSKYGLDPLKLIVTVGPKESATAIMESGAAYHVLAKQAFQITDVEVKP
jgi:uncharacterized phage protein gp47/JayE